MKSDAVYLGSILNPLDYNGFEFIENGCLLVRDGRIVRYGDLNGKRLRGNIMDYSGKVLMPGLVDMHVHLPQYDIVASDGHELLGWLENYTFPAERRFESCSVARDAAKRFFFGLKKNGTTTACVYNTVHEKATDVAFEEADKSGLRVILGKVMMDQNSPPYLMEEGANALRASEYLCKKWHNFDGGRLMYAFTPRFAPTCSMNLMRAVADLARKYDAYVQTHLSENKGELSWVSKLFPAAKNYTDVYRMAGLLRKKTILAHSIYVNDEELGMIKDSQSCIAHCPSSNMFLKSGLFEADRVNENGIRFGLGTDVGGGPSLSMFREMANACNVSKIRYAQTDGKSRAISPENALYLATLGGARALGLDDKIGSFSVGKDADFIIVDPRTTDTGATGLERTPKEILSHLIYRGDDRAVSAVYVRGKKV